MTFIMNNELIIDGGPGIAVYTDGPNRANISLAPGGQPGDVLMQTSNGFVEWVNVMELMFEHPLVHKHQTVRVTRDAALQAFNRYLMTIKLAEENPNKE